MQTQLIAACARVRHEMYIFRQEYLPVFLALTPGEIWAEIKADPQVVKIPSPSVWRRPPPLSAWQRAVEDLAITLPAGAGVSSSKSLHPEAYEEFSKEPLFPGFLPEEQEQDQCLRVVNDTLIWHLTPNSFSSLTKIILPEPSTLIPDFDNVEEWLPLFKAWLMQLPPDSDRLYNSLCAALPYIAYFDPAFAKLALDRTTWETIVKRYPGMSVEQRRKALKLLDNRFFQNVLNNALLHVFAALAGNHFLAIQDMLDHPCIQGGYTHLMPYYLFAILLGKTRVLRRLLDQTGWHAENVNPMC